VPASPADAPAGMRVPEAVREILRREAAGEGAFGQVYVLMTVDPAGYPHVALLTGDQMREGPGGDELRAVVWGARTRAHLIDSGRATLLVADYRFAHYLKLAVVDSVEQVGRLGVVLRLTDCAHDTAGVDLVPMAFRWSVQLAAREGWERDAAMLDLLAQRRPAIDNHYEPGS
jgi:hypothetical protein